MTIMLSDMTTRERFQAVMNFQPFDRLPIIEWAGWWGDTIERWDTEGLPEDLTDRYAICRHFGLDIYLQDWFPIRKDGCPNAIQHGGGIIASMDDYEKVRPFLYQSNVVGQHWIEWAERQKRGEVVLWFSLDGFFWFARELLGIEPHMYAFYDQPELMHRINNDLCEWHLRVIDEVIRICDPDFMTFAEDMSYNLGSMLSKELFDEFMAPYYERVIPKLNEHGIIPLIDSDGDVTEPVHWFEDGGLAGILPLERQAGVDIARLRAEHPRMRFIGHYDKMVMNKGKAAIRAEFERLLPTAAQGGFIISVDHQTPPGVSYDNYKTYVRCFREYAELAGQSATA